MTTPIPLNWNDLRPAMPLLAWVLILGSCSDERPLPREVREFEACLTAAGFKYPGANAPAGTTVPNKVIWDAQYGDRPSPFQVREDEPPDEPDGSVWIVASADLADEIAAETENAYAQSNMVVVGWGDEPETESLAEKAGECRPQARALARIRPS